MLSTTNAEKMLKCTHMIQRLLNGFHDKNRLAHLGKRLVHSRVKPVTRAAAAYGRQLKISKVWNVSHPSWIDSFGDAHCEIYAGDLLDEFEEAKYNPLWTMKGYTQIFHSWRESKR